MQLGDALNNGKTKTGAPCLPAITPPEALKDKIALVFSDARPAIENADRPVLLDDEFHSRSRSGVVYRVFRKVSDRATQHLRIALNPDRFCRAQ